VDPHGFEEGGEDAESKEMGKVNYNETILDSRSWCYSRGVKRHEIGRNVDFDIKVSRDSIMLRVFPLTLTGKAKDGWTRRLQKPYTREIC
ncbi:hypothetical protein Tco_1423984, partial [Tanacetum coccineum]